MSGRSGVERPLRIGVVGSGVASEKEIELALALGRTLARLGAVVICGGRTGVMEAAAKGCAEEGGLAVGVLPGRRAEEANPWIALPLPTGLGEARNALVVSGSEAIVAVGGSWGTLSEIALARKGGVPVCTLGEPPAEGLELPAMASPAEAAEWALGRARGARTGGGAPGTRGP